MGSSLGEGQQCFPFDMTSDLVDTCGEFVNLFFDVLKCFDQLLLMISISMILTIRNALRKFCHVCLIFENWDHHLLNQSTKVFQRVGMNVSTCHVIQQLFDFFRQWLTFSFDKEHSFVPIQEIIQSKPI